MTTKISSLPSLASVTDATIIPVVEGGATKRITGLALKTYTGTSAGPQGPSGPAGSEGSAGSTGPTGPSGPSGAAATVPKITSIVVTDSSYTTLDDTAVGTSGGYIKLIGTGFTAGSQVLIGNVSATSVTFVSVTELRAQLPATSAGTYVVYVVATDGSVAIRVNGITFSATPTWSTGSTLTAGSSNVPISIQLAATSDTAVTYAVAAGSSLPTGLSLSSGGLLSGTITGISMDTTYNFTINAIDAENQDSPRSFSITITVVLQVSRSLRLNLADSSYLSRTSSSAGDTRKCTLSFWLKRTNLGLQGSVFSIGSFITGTPLVSLFFRNDNEQLQMNLQASAYTNAIIANTLASFRDTSAWYHFVLAMDTAQSSFTTGLKLWVNGIQHYFDSGSLYTQNCNVVWNSALTTYIGKFDTNAPYSAIHSCYLAEINMIDGQQLDATYFGEADSDTGVWRPKRYTGTYGTNGYYLNFSDNSNTTAATLGKDSSGNNNNFTPYNFSVTAGAGNDSVVDSPTSYGTDTGVGGEVRGNYATWNPLAGSTSVNPVLSNGNLDVTGGAEYWGRKISTIGMTTGKWYAEVTVNSVGDNTLAFGVTNSVPTTDANNQNGEVSGYSSFIVTYFSVISNYNRLYNSGYTALGGSCSVGDIYGLAFDADAAKIYYYKNGSVLGSASGYTLTTNGQPFFFQILAGNAPVGAASTNFGQRAFAYTAPSGFKALCSQNLPTPTIGVTSSTQASKYFNPVLYTGNGNNTQSITVGFRPDFIWTKSRSNAYFHVLFDAVRGRGMLCTNNTNAEVTSPGSIYELTSYDSNGFTLGPDYSLSVNPNGSSMVAWNWNAGGATVTNTAGSISAQVRANPTSGFSIATYTGVSNGTVGHGLGVAPSMIIVKSRGAQNWFVYHTSLGATKYMTITGDAATTNSGSWNDTSPTSSVFTSGSFFSTNSMVAYCFAEVPGYSKFGSYTGNASTDGPFVYCGFRPRWIMIKRTDSSAAGVTWNIFDAVRPNNYNDSALGNLRANTDDAESVGWPIDFVSNGFKIRYNGETNYAGLHIFAAFAETPFKYARAR
jgi:hypothetical protein